MAITHTIPFYYTVRNLWTRRLTTALTAIGLALVVFVFATSLMLAQGLEETLVDTGSFDNAVVIRKAAGVEIQSAVERGQAAIIESQPQIANNAEGKPIASKELVVLIVLGKRGTDKPSNVVIRGVTTMALTLRPQVKLVQGRMFRPGTSEIITGNGLVRGFNNTAIGEHLRFGQRDWTVVGVFDAGKSGFNSEIWGDNIQLMQAFRRPVYSSVIVRLNDTTAFNALKTNIENDPRLNLEVKRESLFYAEQSEVMAKFIRILGATLSIIFSIGAIIGAMITMYASVANRTAEIGTLRALGFKRSSILWAFLTESLALSAVGGVIGIFCASFMQTLTVSTMNFQTFAELAFSFTLTLQIALNSFVFALSMGLIGGFLPAVRAARMDIVDALRAA
ncbi:MAG: ABC transporter permease [Methylophilaceae bacterium]